MRALAFLASVAVLGLPGAAAAQAPVEAGERASVVEEQEKVICRSVRTTSTRMATRICETKSQREERLKRARDRQAKMDAHGPVGTSCMRSGGASRCGNPERMP